MGAWELLDLIEYYQALMLVQHHVIVTRKHQEQFIQIVRVSVEHLFDGIARIHEIDQDV